MIKSSEKKKELHSALSKSIQIDRRTKKERERVFLGATEKKRFMTQDYIDSEKFSLKAATRTKRQPRRHMEWQSYNRPIWLLFEYFWPVFAYLLSRECPFGLISCGLEKWHMIKSWSFVLEQQYVYLMILVWKIDRKWGYKQAYCVFLAKQGGRVVYNTLYYSNALGKIISKNRYQLKTNLHLPCRYSFSVLQVPQ